jgi:hypothetical protein
MEDRVGQTPEPLRYDARVVGHDGSGAVGRDGDFVTQPDAVRQRRKRLIAAGKMGDGNLVDVGDGVIVYSYVVRGIEYAASQDISTLKQLLPPDLSAMTGPLWVRYDARNPANSIVLDEEWSGIRARK